MRCKRGDPNVCHRDRPRPERQELLTSLLRSIDARLIDADRAVIRRDLEAGGFRPQLHPGLRRAPLIGIGAGSVRPVVVVPMGRAETQSAEDLDHHPAAPF